MALAAGTRLGPYEITGSLGAGGMGEVYRATDTKLGRDVAIKTLPGAFAKDHDRLARFEREAKLLAALNHAHIGAIYGLDEHEGTQYLAMELVEGETLEEKLKGGPLPVEDALRLALQIAEALEAAHEKGVVHRDLKPANIMVTGDGQVKVLDFGLAKAFSGDPNQATAAHSPALSLAMTQQGLILGTAGYMSPEQASGQATDQRADIWAFGVVLYEMLTGLPLFSGETVPHILAAVLQTEPDWNRLPKNLHARLKQLLERCLEKKVRNRYHSIADVRVDIEKVLSDPGATVPALAARPPSRWALPLTGAAVVATAVVAGLAGWNLRPEASPPAVKRFSNDLPSGQSLRFPQTPVMAFSRDGRRFVYNTPDGLYVRSLDQLEARLVAGTEAQQFTTPVLSPDGQSVAYFALPNELRRIAISGGAPLVIATVGPPFGASWELDGTILYGQAEGIFRVSANGGKPELVIPAKEGERLYGPELLPDGDSVLFSTTTLSWDQAQIAVQSLSTGERRVLVNGGSDAHYVPTGHLLYALGTALLGVAFDADSLAVSGEAVPLVQGVMRSTGGVTGTANYAVADDGTLVYVSGDAAAGSNALVWADGKGNEEPLGLAPCNCFDPVVSPDGTRVAVRNGVADGDIWVWSMTQRTFTRLTFEPGTEQTPLWSPDGTRIAYGAPTGLYARRADGTGTAEQLLEGSGLTPWAWTADDELIFMDTSSGNPEIDALALTGDHQRRSVLATDFSEIRPALSPDGHWLAYQSNESGRAEVYVRPFPDVENGKWQVSSGGGEEPRWARDGRTLFFAGPDSLMAAAVESTQPAFTFRTPEAALSLAKYIYVAAFRRYDVSVDGRRFLMVATAAPADAAGTAPHVVVVTNWTQELKRLVPMH